MKSLIGDSIQGHYITYFFFLQVILENFGIYHKLKAYFLVKNTLIFKKKGAPLRFFARCAFITALIIIQIP